MEGTRKVVDRGCNRVGKPRVTTRANIFSCEQIHRSSNQTPYLHAALVSISQMRSKLSALGLGTKTDLSALCDDGSGAGRDTGRFGKLCALGVAEGKTLADCSDIVH